MYDWVLNPPLEGFLKDAPQEEVAIAPVVECLKQLPGKTITNKLAVSSITDTLLKTQFSLTFS